MCIDTLLSPDAEIPKSLGSNFIHWNGYPGDGESMLLKTDGIGIPKNDDCIVCGTLQAPYNPIMESLTDILI